MDKYELGVTRSFAEAMLWVGEVVMFRGMVNFSTVDDVFTHILTEDGGEGGRLLDSADLLNFLKYRDDQWVSKKKVYGPGPVKPAWWELLQGLHFCYFFY